MSPLWRVDVDDYDYDEYDAWIVRAATEEKALELAGFPKRKKPRAKLVPQNGPEERILGSFNCG